MIRTFTLIFKTPMADKVNKTTLVGIAGASGSGKTFLTRKIEKRLQSEEVIHLLADHYYKDSSHLTIAQRNERNYDHPDAIDFPLLIAHLKELQKGHSIAQPLYDFSTHNRTKETMKVGPASAVLLDGVLIFAIPELRKILNLKIYVDTPLDICFIRRLRRDVRERGRTVESVVEQYLSTVRPMFLEFVHPSKTFADLVVVGQGSMDKDTQNIVTLIYKKIRESK